MLYAIILLPLLMGICCAFTKEEQRNGRTIFLMVGQLTVFGLILYAAFSGKDYATSVWHMSESITFALKMDAVGALFCGLTAFCWLLTVPYARIYMTHEGGEPHFYAFLFTTEAAVFGTALAADFLTLYLFFEMTTLLSAPLVLHELTKKALLGASKYLYYSVGGAFLALFGIAVLYGAGVPLIFMPGGEIENLSPLMMLAVFLMIVGFGAKAGMYPLHNWLPSAHPVAPAPAHALLSGIIAKCGVLAILRLIYFVVGVDLLRGSWIQITCLVLTLITIAMGSFMGCTEWGLKKRLAYSSISQISYVLLGVFIMTPLGVAGALLQLFFHALAKIAIFQSAGAIIFLTGNTRIDQFRALGRRIPHTFVCFTLVSLSLIGIPPFGGFWSKWYLGIAALNALPTALAYLAPAVLIASALLTAGYLFQPIISAFFPGEDCPPALMERIKEPPLMMISLTIFAALCGILGFMPNAVLQLMERIAATVM